MHMLMRSALSQRWLVGMGESEHIVKIVSSLLDTLVYRPPHPDQESMSSFVPKYAYTHVPLALALNSTKHVNAQVKYSINK
jgi:hypothetical protein